MITHLMLAGAAVAASSGSYIDDGMPPPNYMQDNSAVVSFVRDVAEATGVKVPEGYKLMGLTEVGGLKMTIPNPCLPHFAMEEYASIVCHELGHLNGWPANHPRP